MAEANRPVHCTQCGSPAQAGDRFCGVCGARIAPDAQDPSPAREIPTQVPPPPNARARSSNRRLFLVVAAGALLIFLLVGAGLLALSGLGPATDLLGGLGGRGSGSGFSASSPVAPDAPPDPAFDLLLPTLEEGTTAPIWLPARLPSVLENVAVDGYATGDGASAGDGWGVVFLLTPPDEVVGEWSRAETVGTLAATPEDEAQENEYFEATSTETVELLDGTEATLSRMVPAQEGGTQGPYWEGAFERDGYAYTLAVVSEAPTEGDVRRALSSMVLVRGAVVAQGETTQTMTAAEVTELTTTGPTTTPAPGEPDRGGADLREAVEGYYRAVDQEDWDYTYEHLASGTRRQFTEEEWRLKNEWFADNYPQEFASIDIETEVIGDSAEVRIVRRFEDGTSQPRLTYFRYEDGSWKHQFGQEEYDLFMPDASYEEFVAAQR